MIRVLIAEDEPPTMRRIKRMIENSDLPFEVAVTAFDGEEALQEMEKQPCDVVFTDIKMPVMDGLTLMDRIQERYPDCSVVIVSGYQEFEYAAHAIRGKAVDYLLKPVSQEDMRALLQRLQAACEKRKQETLTHKLSAIISGMDSLDDASGKSITRQEEQFHIALLCAGPMPLSENNELLAGNDVFEAFRIEELFREIVPNASGFLWSFAGSTPVEQILIFSAAGQNAHMILQSMMDTIGNHTAVPVSVLYSSKSVTLQHIGKMIRKLRKNLVYAIKIGSSMLLPVDAGPSTEERLSDSDIARCARIIADWLCREVSLNARDWGSILSDCNDHRWMQHRLYHIFLKAITYLEAEKGLTESIIQAQELVAEIMETALSIEDVCNGLVSFSALFTNEKEVSVTQENVAAQVEEYLQKHYDQHISTQLLSAVFGYVPSYISLLYRKAYGISPSEYLTRLRLQHAKMMIRNHPEMLMRDVAEKVGFKDPHHFSKTFKKYEGVWPTDFMP